MDPTAPQSVATALPPDLQVLWSLVRDAPGWGAAVAILWVGRRYLTPKKAEAPRDPVGELVDLRARVKRLETQVDHLKEDR